MELTLFGIKNCDTMKKAMKWLDDNGVAYHFHDYKKEGVPEQRLRQWLEALGWETVINKRGTTWRKLDDVVKESMNTEKSVNLAMENSSVIKRPILQSNDFILAGFKADEWENTLK
ncbi:ArsC family reductase [Alcanivorax sp. VBW004]|uniref:ArsC family reductase n=1 Tax=Alcanivorax sp. VBW004 TaxID=1287708 RepID=UPI0012BD1F09|nr:ArsC family reductase [Alcanivorax sp. VBW004]MTT53162.1 ArsC family reductase [Alcanivorax sp. VBW004]